MDNKNHLYFLEHSLIEWSSDNSKESQKIIKKLKLQLKLKQLLLDLKITD